MWFESIMSKGREENDATGNTIRSTWILGTASLLPQVQKPLLFKEAPEQILTWSVDWLGKAFPLDSLHSHAHDHKSNLTFQSE